MRLAICDDAAEVRELVKDICCRVNGLYNIQTFTDGAELIEHYRSGSVPFDIVILDIYMNVMGGMETAKRIRELDDNVFIIFLTETRDYALESYDVSTFAYLMKPIQPRKLAETVEKAIKKLKLEAQTIMVTFAKAVHKVNVTDIVYIEMVNRQVFVHMEDGSVLRSTQAINYFVRCLPHDIFIEIDQSILLNLYYAQKVDKALRSIVLRGGKTLPIARPRLKHVLDAYIEVAR